jgi:hypothetical protein
VAELTSHYRKVATLLRRYLRETDLNAARWSR